MENRIHGKSCPGVKCYSAYLLVLVIVFIMVVAVAQATIIGQAEPPDTGRDDHDYIVLKVPAVTGNNGKIISIIVKKSITPGVRFNGAVDIGEDTLASAWTAYLISSLLSGESPFDNGIEITVLTDSNNVEGPSASLAIAVAVYALQAGKAVHQSFSNYSITGAISLDGASVIVGGTLEKLEATIDKGLGAMILPAPNAVILENKAEIEGNTRLVPVYGLLDAYDVLISRETIFSSWVETGYPKELAEYLSSIRGEFRTRAQETAMGLDNATRARVAYYLNESDREFSRGRYYSSASLAYTAYLAALAANLSSASEDNLENMYDILVKELDSIKKVLSYREQELYRKGSIGQYELELLAISESRAWMCEALLREYKASQLSREARIDALIQAKARCETAKTWIKALDIRWENQPLISYSLLEKVIDEYNTFLEYAMTYVSKAVEMQGMPPRIKIYFDELKDLASRINKASQKGSPGLRLGLSVELSSRLSSFLTQMNFIEPKVAEGYVRELWRNFAVLSGNLASYGRSSIMASMYAEYASYEGHDPLTIVSLLDTAITSLHPLLIYSMLEEHGAEGSSVENASLSNNTATIIERYQYWIAFSILSTMVGIIVARLYTGRVFW